jgi:hypothetical protein
VQAAAAAPRLSSESVSLGEAWRLRRRVKCNEPREAVCRPLSHQFGWELRLGAGGQLLQSHVCRSQDEVLTTAESWKAAMLEKGWQRSLRRLAPSPQQTGALLDCVSSRMPDETARMLRFSIKPS